LLCAGCPAHLYAADDLPINYDRNSSLQRGNAIKLFITGFIFLPPS
jgi:hypothetical protein